MRPGQLFSTRAGSLDWRPLGLPPANIFSISRSGRLAVALVTDPLRGFQPATLAESSLDGAAPRPILEGVIGADWSPDGRTLAVVRVREGLYQLEYPIGKKLYESNLRLFEPRVSPDGGSVAVVEGGERTPLRVLDGGGAVRTVVEDSHGSAACWSPDGRELWWIRQPASFVLRAQTSEFHAVTLGGRDRVVTCLPGEMNLLDIAADVRLLVEEVSKSFTMSVGSSGPSAERSLAWLDQSIPISFSPDGQTLAFADRGDVTGSTVAAYLRKLDGSTPVRLGEGSGGTFSPDGKWVMVCRKLPKHYVVLIPTGAGEERVLEPGAPIPDGNLVFHPDGKRIYLDGIESGHRQRVYEQSVEGAPPKPVTPEGYLLELVSPDGKLLMARGEGAREVTLFPTDSGTGLAPRTVALESLHDRPIHWSADGRSVLVLAENTRPIRVDRLDLATGRRAPWRSFSPGTPLGAGGLTSLVINRSEDAWAVGYCRQVSTLLVISGLEGI